MATQVDTQVSSPMGAPQIAVLLTAALQVLTPLMPQLGLGEQIGSQSDAVRTLITPAGWAFGIWGALYTGAAVFAVYQALPSQRGHPVLRAIRWLASGAFLGNAVWAAYVQLLGLNALSVLIIAATLVCLIKIYRIVSSVTLTTSERWYAWLPLSALAAWLTIATIVNIAASLRYHGVEGGPAAPAIGAAVLVIAGLIAAAALIRGRGNLSSAAMFLWALTAIYAAGGQESGLIAVGTSIAALLVIGGSVAGRRRASKAGAAIT